MPDQAIRLEGPYGRRIRVGHLTTVDMSLALLLETELRVDVESGCEVYGISAPGPYVEEVEEWGVRHVPVPALTRAWDPRRDAAAGRDIVDALRALRLDVLHTHNPKTGILGRVLGRALRVPVVVNTCHGLWSQAGDAPLRRTLVVGAEAAAARCSHAELYQNATDCRTLRWALAGRRYRVVGNGTDLDRFRFDPAGRARVRRELGVADDELVVGGVGRRVAEKGVAVLAAVARRLAGKARFVWVGPTDPDKPDRLDGGSAAELAGLEFLPARRDMPALYSALDVFALPSYREGFSRSAMEAAACGRAMVLSDIRGCREIGRAGRDLLLVPPGDDGALADAVARLLLDSELRARLGCAAARRAELFFDQRKVALASLETYVEVARRRGLDWRLTHDGGRSDAPVG